MAVRDIRTSIAITACDICGRTLLVGETPRVFIDGGVRRSVCELCTERAHHEGWVREGVEVPADPHQASERRRSLFGRLRRRPQLTRGPDVEPPEDAPQTPQRPTEPDEAPHGSWLGWLRGRAASRRDLFFPDVEEPPGAPGAEQTPASNGEATNASGVPAASPQHWLAAAVEAFNQSEHRRTVAGVGRSLGLPTVSVRATESRPALVTVVASWELCWYRYEVDVSDEAARVRVASQGWELDELPDIERVANAAADEMGALRLLD